MSHVDWFDPAVIQAHQPGRVRREQIAQTTRIQKAQTARIQKENKEQKSRRFHNAIDNENVRLGVLENNERNKSSLKDFIKTSKANHDWNYRKIREKKEKEGMSKNDVDAGRNHPEDHLTVTEPLTPNNTNLHASLPRKSNRVGKQPVGDKFLQGYHNSRIPDDVRKIVKSYIKPGREPMTSLEAIRFHNRGDRHHAEKKTMRREVVPRQVAGDPEEVKFRYSKFNNFRNKLNKTGRSATFTEF
jgi:hypothetical protein